MPQGEPLSTHLGAASDRLAVAVGTPILDHATASTTLNVKRWDAEQTAWLVARGLAKNDLPPGWEPQGRHFEQANIRPYSETEQANCNMIMQSGWASLLGGIAAAPISAMYSATNGRIGVGTSNTAAVETQTWLQGDTGSASTTSWYQLCTAAPAIVTTTIPATFTLTATFGSGNANFSWNEFGSDNASASGVYLNGLAGGFVLLNRGVSSQGTKASGQTWTATESISLGYPSGAGTLS
jgi:hypothetical protein